VNISLFSDFRHLWQLINVSEIGNLRVSTCTVSPNILASFRLFKVRRRFVSVKLGSCSTVFVLQPQNNPVFLVVVSLLDDTFLELAERSMTTTFIRDQSAVR